MIEELFKKENRWAGSCIAVGILLLALLIWHYDPIWETDATIRGALEKVKTLDNPPAYMELEEKDAWNQPLIFRFDKSTARLTYKVISKGPDGKEGTEDDRSGAFVDYNVSRIIGSWTAEKAREFLKGVKEGLEKKSKFDEEKK